MVDDIMRAVREASMVEAARNSRYVCDCCGKGGLRLSALVSDPLDAQSSVCFDCARKRGRER